MDVTLSTNIPKSLESSTIEVTGTSTAGDKLFCLHVETSTEVSVVEMDPESLFKEFVAKFEKKYQSEEERARRLVTFTVNLGALELMKKEDPSAQYSHLSPFADWKVEEFAARNNLQSQLFDTATIKQADRLDVSDLPDSFDWRDKGAVNPVKNQAQCGSCWAFSTVGNIEGVNFIKTGQLLSLSEQELVDCDTKTGDEGCQGGLPSNAFKDMIANKIGLELESDYPYTAKNDKCTASQAKEKVFISNWTAISTDEDQIAAALMQYGPLSIGINAFWMQFYSGGVANPPICSPKKLDHGVVIVGFGTDSGKKYWTIRNSWGTTWGEKGYYRIIRGTGKCGLNTMVTTASIGDAQVQATCSGSGDPAAATCYEGAAGALGLKETVKLDLKTYASGNGTMELSGSGIEAFTCTDHAFTKAGQEISVDVSDCVPSAITVSDVKYCSDSDQFKVTVKDKAVPLPISAMMSKVTCPSITIVV